ncbi:hypothetical protein C8J56DRAFT_1089929 [Mycena floridula]|nr:hypothetical protein C8J56DRAFT_1089929 [Mycena floridula]
MKRLSKLATQFRLIFSHKPDTVETQPPSKIPECSTRVVAKQWLQPFTEIWSDNMLCTSDLDTIKESTALNDSLEEFYKREITSLLWTLEHMTNDGELLLFLEGILVYLNSQWLDLHFGKLSPSPWGQALDDHSLAQFLQAALQHSESTFLSKLDTFVSTQTQSMNKRDVSAVLNALSSLFEKNIFPYTEVTRFLHSWLSGINLQSFVQ